MAIEPEVMDAQEVGADAAQLEARRNAKREAAKRFTERKAAERAERAEKANKLIGTLKKENLWQRIGTEHQEFLEALTKVSAGGSGMATGSTFATMFGPDAKVGTKVTLMEAFERTRKGQNEIDRLIRSKWAAKGIVVKYTRDDKDIFKSTYEITELPAQ